MLINTEGIVIKTTPYSDTSVIAKIYTRKWGMQAYLIQGAKRKKAAIGSSMLQPLMMLEMVAYHKTTRNLQRLREAKALLNFASLPYDIAKSAIALFMAELINKCVKEEEPNDVLFEFLADAIQRLDQEDFPVANFPFFFMTHFSYHLGFFPNCSAGETLPFFHLEEGSFFASDGDNDRTIRPPESTYLHQAALTPFPDFYTIKIPPGSRHILLEKMISYYSMHLENFSGLNSYRILAEVLKR